MSEDRYTIELGGERYGPGTALEVLRAMKTSPWEETPPSNGEYLDWLVTQAKRLTGVNLNVHGTTLEERARCLLDEMLRAGLAQRVGS